MPANPYKAIAAVSAKKTNDQLKQELVKLMPMSEQDLRKMVPTRRQKEELVQLMTIVKGATTENNKKAALIRDINKLAGVTLKALGALT